MSVSSVDASQLLEKQQFVKDKDYRQKCLDELKAVSGCSLFVRGFGYSSRVFNDIFYAGLDAEDLMFSEFIVTPGAYASSEMNFYQYAYFKEAVFLYNSLNKL